LGNAAGVEAFDLSILPWAAGFDRGVHCGFQEIGEEGRKLHVADFLDTIAEVRLVQFVCQLKIAT
jgi:hypothetical protein